MCHLRPCSAALAFCLCLGLINGFHACPAMPAAVPCKGQPEEKDNRKVVTWRHQHEGSTAAPGRLRSHVDRVSVCEQKGLAISQGSDIWNGLPGTLCHSAWVRARPIDPAQLSEAIRGPRLRSSTTGLHSQGLRINNIRVASELYAGGWIGCDSLWNRLARSVETVVPSVLSMK